MNIYHLFIITICSAVICQGQNIIPDIPIDTTLQKQTIITNTPESTNVNIVKTATEIDSVTDDIIIDEPIIVQGIDIFTILPVPPPLPDGTIDSFQLPYFAPITIIIKSDPNNVMKPQGPQLSDIANKIHLQGSQKDKEIIVNAMVIRIGSTIPVSFKGETFMLTLSEINDDDVVWTWDRDMSFAKIPIYLSPTLTIEDNSTNPSNNFKSETETTINLIDNADESK